MKNMRNVLHEILGEDVSSGEALRAFRVKAGISQDQMQEITGVARSNISALENDRMEMTSHYAIIFGAALKIHPSEILFPNGKVAKTDEILKIEKKAAAFQKKRIAV